MSTSTTSECPFDGSTRCRTCGCAVLIPSGKAPKALRRKLALADHVLTLHAPLKWSAQTRKIVGPKPLFAFAKKVERK